VDPTLAAQLEELIKALKPTRTPGRPDTKGIDTAAAEKAIDEWAKKLHEQTAELTKSQPKLKTFADVLSGRGVKGADALFNELEHLEKQLKEAVEAGEGRVVSELELKKATIAQAAAVKHSNAAVINMASAITKNLTGSLIDGTINFAKGLQSSQSGVEIYGDVAKAAGKSIASTIESVGGGLSTVGDGLSKLPGPIGAVGVSLQIFGAIISKVGTFFGKISEEGINMLKTEVAKTQKTFSDVSNAGALFANGMTGMRNSAAQAGLTVEQFGEVLKTSSANTNIN